MDRPRSSYIMDRRCKEMFNVILGFVLCVEEYRTPVVLTAFEEMLKENEIEHVLTTLYRANLYMLSSNGLAKRTIKTLCEVLQRMCKSMNH